MKIAVKNSTHNVWPALAEYMNPMLPGGGSSPYHYNYTYDNLNRLTSATFGFGSSGSNSDFQLSGIEYDRAGNLQYLQRRDQNGNLIDNLTYDYTSGTDQISDIEDAVSSGLNWDARSATYGYDANGNLTSRSDKLSKISYDWRNLPVDFDLTNGQEIVDNYNAGGQRILKELKGGDWTFYVKDGNKTLAVINQDTVNHFNLFGNSLFGRYEPSNGARRYYLKDNLGSTRMVTDNNGNILQTFDYYPFGLLMPDRNGGSGSTMEKFTGKELDSEAGLNLDYFGARYYDAAVGRWLSVDPLAKKYPGWSPYNYGLDNPIFFIDKFGEAPDEFDVDRNTGTIVWISNKGGNKIDYFNIGQTNNKGKFVATSTFVVGRGKGSIDSFRFWESNKSTISAFVIPGTKMTGNILEPPGPSTATANIDKRILEGTYNLMKNTGGKHFPNNFKLYNNNVSAKRGILMHRGNFPGDTHGCLLLGCGWSPNKIKGGTSKVTVQKVNNYINKVGVQNVKVNIFNIIQ